MKNLYTATALIIVLTLTSCFNERKPNYQFMPDMYHEVGYDAYDYGPIFENGQSSRLPVQGTVPRGYVPYEFEDTFEDRQRATAELKNPLPITEENLLKGKELYGFFCAVCHGDKGDGQGILAQREKFLGIPSYADPGRNITEGSIYHVQMYGLNSMGDFTAQTTHEERWQIAMHVQNLKAELTGGPKLTPVTIEENKNPTTASEEIQENVEE